MPCIGRTAPAEHYPAEPVADRALESLGARLRPHDHEGCGDHGDGPGNRRGVDRLPLDAQPAEPVKDDGGEHLTGDEEPHRDDGAEAGEEQDAGRDVDG
ncbi:MAG TPA: hypothetical protein VKA41_10775 [Solirubrobacterales bacterium]|nr:hypothetical protein [Solirubrobacterales bacterium]